MTVTSDTVFTALRSFLTALIPGVNVIKGLSNNVAMPGGDFIAMTPLYQNRLATNLDTYNDLGTVLGGTEIMTQSTQYTIQIDCFGPNSPDYANMITTAFRDDYGYQALQPNCTPLHADDPKQIPLVTAESQYEQRWSITALIQYLPQTIVPMQFFTKASTTISPALK